MYGTCCLFPWSFAKFIHIRTFFTFHWLFQFFSPRQLKRYLKLWHIMAGLFPRASERRVLPIVGVCISSSHLLIFTPSHLHIFSSSHLLNSHLLNSHLLIFTSSHLHIFSSSHRTFSSSHLLTSHLLIFTSSHLHIFSSSHLLIFTSSHLHIFSSSQLLIFTSSHLLIFISSHPRIFSSCPLALLPSCPLAFSFFSISLLKAGAGAVPTRQHETQPFCTK